ncbi:PilN domain-containing protein [Herbaspirillum sp. YR522]|uniref:PilN domain-containing protein n=1 Tax=Herbaspirillum sp. YR522 TaxID=1144342 RepID=UPI00026F7FB8|nr:PilN domain-containing protein [Herbaspirillum sp. YR522]EJN01222.1 Fimbrial assembly protein (PilN) [Herbaspirillum sp. YR522]
MNPEHDFSRSPRQRQRHRETGFYCMLGLATALAVAAVLALDWSIDDDSARLQSATATLQAELAQLQPRLAQVAALESGIATQQGQLQLQLTQASQRAFAPRALHALAAVSPTDIRLHQITVRTGEAEIRGAASGQQQLQDLVEALQASGLGQVRLQEMRQETHQDAPHDPLAIPPLPYRFTLRLDGSDNVTDAGLPAQQQQQQQQQSSRHDAVQAPRARRT